MKIEEIEKWMVIKPGLLNPVKVNEILSSDMELFDNINAGFCFDNSRRILEQSHKLEKIVYGICVVEIGGKPLPVQHGWNKGVDGAYYDVTYQSFPPDKIIKYYSLVELTFDEYLTEASKIYPPALIDIATLDLYQLRTLNLLVFS